MSIPAFELALDEHVRRLNLIHFEAGHPELPDAFWRDLIACEEAISKSVAARNMQRLNQILNTIERGLKSTLAKLSELSSTNGAESCQQGQPRKKPQPAQQTLWNT